MTVNTMIGIYLARVINADIIEIVGIGTAIYYFTKGVLQVPVGVITDRIKKDRDDILFLFIGNLLMGAPFLFFPLINNAYQYYILQFLMGLGAAMNLVNWRKLFAKNLDEGEEGLEYGVYDSVFSVAVSLFGIVLGYIANLGSYYFDFVMVSVGVLMLSSGFWVLSIFFVKNRKSF